MICVIGDVLLDKYSYGNVYRISREAPIPILVVDKEYFSLGGAGNAAMNVFSLGSKVFLIGVGGKELEKFTPFDHFYIDDGRPTTIKNRFISSKFSQQLLRADYECKRRISEENARLICSKVKSINPDYILIADYGNGVITKELMEGLKSLNIPIYVDPRKRNIKFYKNVDLVKPNLKELSDIVGYDVVNEDKYVENALEDARKILNSIVLVTRGKKGASLITKDVVKHFPADTIEVYDVTGAGDTFIASLLVHMEKGYSLEESIVIANLASGIAVSRLGTYAVRKEELDELISKKLKRV